MEKLETLIALYKKNDITDYVLERELGAFMGDNSSVRLSHDSKNNLRESFCIFPLPELLVEGFHITYIIDKNAIMNFYNKEEDLINALNELKKSEQGIYAKFNDFLKVGKNRDITLNYAIGFLLDLYKSVKDCLYFEDCNFLPSDEELNKAIELFTTETATKEDLEKILINELICSEIVEFAKKYSKVAPGLDMNLKIEKDALGKPLYNYNYQHIMDSCTSTFGERDHKEIPYNYYPSTNQ